MLPCNVHMSLERVVMLLLVCDSSVAFSSVQIAPQHNGSVSRQSIKAYRLVRNLQESKEKRLWASESRILISDEGMSQSDLFYITHLGRNILLLEGVQIPVKNLSE